MSDNWIVELYESRGFIVLEIPQQLKVLDLLISVLSDQSPYVAFIVTLHCLSD